MIYIMCLQNLSDLGIDLCSHLLIVKSDVAVGYSIHGFLLMLIVTYSNIWPISAALLHRRLRNLSDLDCDLSRSPKVKCGGAKQSPYMLSYNV